MEELCWDDEEGIFLTRYLKDGVVHKSRTRTLSSVLPLFTGLISKEKAARLVEEHIRSEGEFWTPYPLSFVSIDDPRERPGWRWWSLPMLWRGGTWVNMNWMVAVGLMEYGYREEAADLTRHTAEMILREGYREFFDSRTGKGYGGKSYGWSTLVVDMLERCRS
jgi:neutral trehalase